MSLKYVVGFVREFVGVHLCPDPLFSLRNRILLFGEIDYKTSIICWRD